VINLTQVHRKRVNLCQIPCTKLHHTRVQPLLVVRHPQIKHILAPYHTLVDSRRPKTRIFSRRP
jgi:hypothetical protein